MGPEGLQFGAEEEPAVEPAVVEGLDADGVADEGECALLSIPDGEGEHADQLGHGASMPQCWIAARRTSVSEWPRNGWPSLLQIAPEVGVVVDFAVEYEHEPLVGRDHGLVAQLGEIEDREPAVSQGDAGLGIDPRAPIIGSAMGERVGHRGDAGADFVREKRGRIEEASDAAHGSCQGSGFSPGSGGEESSSRRTVSKDRCARVCEVWECMD